MDACRRRYGQPALPARKPGRVHGQKRRAGRKSSALQLPSGRAERRGCKDPFHCIQRRKRTERGTGRKWRRAHAAKRRGREKRLYHFHAYRGNERRPDPAADVHLPSGVAGGAGPPPEPRLDEKQHRGAEYRLRARRPCLRRDPPHRAEARRIQLPAPAGWPGCGADDHHLRQPCRRGRHGADACRPGRQHRPAHPGRRRVDQIYHDRAGPLSEKRRKSQKPDVYLCPPLFRRREP